jgi:2-oxoglutarate/2-oxoacid ferredoxin oxidoreductase subunit beta
MTEITAHSMPPSHSPVYTLRDYQSNVSRWCKGCGDNAILRATQLLCEEEQLAPEKTVFVSGIGCAARFPHYMKTYGFHGLHGRALPMAEGIKIRRPDLNVFVNTGDGDCCSIGTAHWVHAVRYNMDMVCVLHDNAIYGLTKMQVSPTSPRGLKSNTSPRGAWLDPINPLLTTLSVSNVSFVAQAVDWNPSILSALLSRAFHHTGFSFIRVIQRCTNYLPTLLDPWAKHREKVLVLTHEKGLQLDEKTASRYPNQREHDPLDIHEAREIASDTEQIPVGILYQDESVPGYDDIRRPRRRLNGAAVGAALDRELDKFTVEPLH